jgi:hypothetical protein
MIRFRHKLITGTFLRICTPLRRPAGALFVISNA